MLIRIRNLIPTNAKLQPFFFPYLTYCHLVWHFFFKSSDSRRVERVQEKGLRADYKDKHPTYESLLQKPKLPTLLNRHNLSPLNICNIFHEQKSSYSLRQSDFSFPRYNAITYGKHSLHYLDSTLWSKLTTADRSVTSLPSCIAIFL